MDSLHWGKNDSVGVITMSAGENRQNPQFVSLLMTILDEIEKDPSISSVVLASSDVKNWSLGIDLQWFAESRHDSSSIKDFLYLLNSLYKRMLLYPMPITASINGHAFGAGAILACVCDFRFMKADRGFFCFPEIDIGIPFLPGMLAILGKAIPTGIMQELILTGRRATAPELAANQIIIKSCANEEILQQEVLEFAGTLKKERRIFGEIKKRLHSHIIQVMENIDPPFIENI